MLPSTDTEYRFSHFRALSVELEKRILSYLCARGKFVQTTSSWIGHWINGPFCDPCLIEDEARGLQMQEAADEVSKDEYDKYHHSDSDC